MVNDDRDRMPDLAFQIMSAIMVLQELFPRFIDRRISGFGLKKGQTIVDYGCGPGRFTIRFAKIVGDQGKVYAVDVQELALEYVKRKMKSQKIGNIVPILARAYQTGIPDHSVDIVLALDMFFAVKDPATLLAEIHRILRSDGLLILDDGHKSRESILEKINRSGIWKIKEANHDHLRCLPN